MNKQKLLRPIKTWSEHTCNDKFRGYNSKHNQVHHCPTPYVQGHYDKLARIEKANQQKRKSNLLKLAINEQKMIMQGKNLTMPVLPSKKLVVERTPLKTFVVKKERGVVCLV